MLQEDISWIRQKFEGLTWDQIVIAVTILPLSMFITLLLLIPASLMLGIGWLSRLAFRDNA